MNIAVEKQLQKWIADQVKSGRYRSETEVVEEALREKMEKDDAEHLWERIQESERAIDHGEYVIADEAFFERKRQMIRDRYMKPER